MRKFKTYNAIKNYLYSQNNFLWLYFLKNLIYKDYKILFLKK